MTWGSAVVSLSGRENFDETRMIVDDTENYESDMYWVGEVPK